MVSTFESDRASNANVDDEFFRLAVLFVSAARQADDWPPNCKEDVSLPDKKCDVLQSDAESNVLSAGEEGIEGDDFSANSKIDDFSVDEEGVVRLADIFKEASFADNEVADCLAVDKKHF